MCTGYSGVVRRGEIIKDKVSHGWETTGVPSHVHVANKLNLHMYLFFTCYICMCGTTTDMHTDILYNMLQSGYNNFHFQDLRSPSPCFL